MLNRIKKLILPEDVDNENKEIVPTYNRSGGLEKVHLDGDEYVKEIVYDVKGQRLLISFGNGVMNRYAYDAQNFRLKRMKSEKYTYSESATERTYEVLNGTTRQDIGYEYDLNGNILKKKNRTPDCGISGTALGVDALDNLYTYDAISRLLNASGRESNANNESHRWADAPAAGSPNASNTQSYNRQYTYDKVGNVKTLQQTGTNAFTRTFNYKANTLNNITVSGTPTVFMHDANGNMTQSSSSRFYEWNEHDQMVFFKVQAGGTPSVYAHYLYDSGGNRTKKIVWDQQGNKEVTVYIDGVFEYRLKQEGATEKEQNIIHVMDDSTRIAQLRVGTAFTDDISEEVHYILDDHLGSSNARLDDTGSIIDRQEYYPFGDTSLRTFSKKRYQYVGKEKDSESGLIYCGARYYAPWLCRFISVDPAKEQRAWLTPYNYVQNNPINLTDPTGALDTGGGDEQQPVKKGDTFFGDDGKTYTASIDEVVVTGVKPNKENKEGKDNRNIIDKGLDAAGKTALRGLAGKISTLKESDVLDMEEHEKQFYFRQSTDDTVAILMYEFINGVGITDRKFDGNDAITKDLLDSEGLKEGLNEFYKQNKEAKIPSEVQRLKPKLYEFSPQDMSGLELMRSGIEHLQTNDWMERFLGSYTVSISLNANSDLSVEIYNETSRNSLMGHNAESRSDEGVELQTRSQTIRFTIKRDPNRLNLGIKNAVFKQGR